MIAPLRRFDLRRAAEFAHSDDERAVEHGAIGQVFKQRAECPVKRRQAVFLFEHGVSGDSAETAGAAVVVPDGDLIMTEKRRGIQYVPDGGA